MPRAGSLVQSGGGGDGGRGTGSDGDRPPFSSLLRRSPLALNSKASLYTGQVRSQRQSPELSEDELRYD